MNLYTIYDRLAEACAPPFTAVNHAVARRMYANTFEGTKYNPNEYKLVFMGSYSEKSSVLEPLAIPEDIYVDLKQEVLKDG